MVLFFSSFLFTDPAEEAWPGPNSRGGSICLLLQVDPPPAAITLTVVAHPQFLDVVFESVKVQKKVQRVQMGSHPDAVDNCDICILKEKHITTYFSPTLVFKYIQQTLWLHLE